MNYLTYIKYVNDIKIGIWLKEFLKVLFYLTKKNHLKLNCEKKQSSIQIISYNSLFKSIIKVNWKRNHFSTSLSVEYWNIFWGDFLGHNWLRFTWSDPLREKKKDSGKYIAKTNTVYYGYIYPINWEQIKKIVINNLLL